VPGEAATISVRCNCEHRRSDADRRVRPQPESELLSNETGVLTYPTSNVASINSAVSRHRAGCLSASALSVLRVTRAATQ
jgi:hypothetical protein